MIRDPKTKKVISPVAQPGYYPGFSTLAQKNHWDEATLNAIEKRISKTWIISFFTDEEAKTLEAVLNVVLPQDDRDQDHKIPLLASIDERLKKKRFEGYIHEGSLEEDLAHRAGLEGIEAIARALYQKSFTELSLSEQEDILISIKDGVPDKAWNSQKLGPKHYWNLLIQDAVSAYYAHPFAWDEIGFGGPAYPRGYMRLTGGLPEPWEKDERRYEWLAPAETKSDSYKPNEELFSGSGHHGQSGTH